MGKDKKEKKKVSVKQAMSYDETIAFLEALLDSFKGRNVVVHGEENSISVVPSDEINMEIKAKVKKDKVKMKIELGWREVAVTDPEMILGKEAEPVKEAAAEEAQPHTQDEADEENVDKA